MNRSVLSALGLVGALALVATPAAAQHRRGGEERGNGSGQDQQGQQRQESRQPESRAAQPAQAPPSPRAEAGAVPRQGVERAVPRQGVERTVPRQDVERAVPRQQAPRGDNQRNDNRRYDGQRNDNQRNDNGRYDNRRYDDRRYDNGRYDNRRYGYAAPRYVGPRSYSGRYYGPRYGGPRFTIAPRRFYRPYYVFRPRLSIGFGIWAGFPVSYYDPYYYPYDYYPYASATPGYVPPQGSVNVQPNQANMGGLSFSISPDTAEVWVDGEYFGTVGEFTAESQPLGLPAGRHHIELREPGYQVSSFDVDIVAGQVIPYQGQLEP
jgi:hypothetical protein